MPLQVYFESHFLSNINSNNITFVKHHISQQYGVPNEDLYATVNGKILHDEQLLSGENVVRVFTRLVGGKGGFGSMLRAIGAQIEKTTNREACRDLSGRRLRDINEEKRLRKWLDGKEEREREAAERKQKKLERLIAEPKINVSLDSAYEKERQEIPERVSAAIDAGWEAAGTSVEAGTKRKADDKKVKSKKAKMWIDADLSDCSSSDEEDVKDTSPGPVVTTDSGNDTDASSKV